MKHDLDIFLRKDGRGIWKYRKEVQNDQGKVYNNFSRSKS